MGENGRRRAGGLARFQALWWVVRSMVRQSAERLGLGVLTAGVVLALSAGSAEAGLFEVLFGQRAPVQQRYYAPEPGLNVTVQPRAPAHKTKSREAAGAHRTAEPRPTALQTPMDIEGDPDWFLRDVTLRRGDIIVRGNRTLVYEGGRHAPTLGDFVDLNASRLLGKRAKATIKQLVEVPREDLVEFVVHRAVKPTVIGANGGVAPPTLGSSATLVADQANAPRKTRR
jgi:hypothetical protein